MMDLYRPIYHFMPEKNWMNDPNGPIYFNEKYHMFYQYNPTDFHWDTMHWGHASSTDLVHWEHLPIALYPSTELGETHCFSGCAVVDAAGLPVIFYTSVGDNERNARDGAQQWMAISRDNMETFEKVELNPILSSELHGADAVKEWRDPFVWREENVWFMVLGGEHRGKGCVCLYSSEDLFAWEFLGILFESPEYQVLECPNMIKFEDKYVLVYSPCSEVVYHVGTINANHEFVTEYQGKVDNSGFQGFYAPNTLISAPDDRKIMWGWMTENARGEFSGADGWSGALSIPRVLTLENNRLMMEPVEEYSKLRQDEIHFCGNILQNEKHKLANAGRAMEISLRIPLEKKVRFAVNVLEANDGSEKTSICFDADTRKIWVDREKSSLSTLTIKTSLCGTLEEDGRPELDLHIFVDHSILEVFANGSVCISTRVYPVGEDSCGASIEVLEDGELMVLELRSWGMRSIWENGC